MKNISILLILFLSFVSIHAQAQQIKGISQNDLNSYLSAQSENSFRNPLLNKIYLRKAEGLLSVETEASTPTYTTYFHVPVSFGDQVPIHIEIESPHLIDYRFVKSNSPNVIIAADMYAADSTYLNWTAWVLIRNNEYHDLPDELEIPELEQLPDSVIKWLMPTDVVQVDDTLVTHIADSIRGNTTDLFELADDIAIYCRDIPGTFLHNPMALDAVYALRWGNSCTGHGHAAAALFRANGIPARNLHNIPTWYAGYMDMHWIIDYYVPEYGWVKLESTLGTNYYNNRRTVITYVNHPTDEFPLFFNYGIEGQWHTSDPAIPLYNPVWGRSHRAYDLNCISDSISVIDEAMSITKSVFNYSTIHTGMILTEYQLECLNTANNLQQDALNYYQADDLENYISTMKNAEIHHKMIMAEPIEIRFFDDFEPGLPMWTHGGEEDCWERGEPVYDVGESYSGLKCWGTNLDGEYPNNADCWLLSPEIDLTGLACAYLDFGVWNTVYDFGVYSNAPDYLWLDITLDGQSFIPLCSQMIGGNDDPVIPQYGGWNMLSLDLSKYVGEKARIRYRFKSNGSITHTGSYIDDVKVYGRELSPVDVTIEEMQNDKKSFHLFQNQPNPFIYNTEIKYSLTQSANVKMEIYNMSGIKIDCLIDEKQPKGNHSILWTPKNSSNGIFFIKLSVDGLSEMRKCIYF